MDRQGAIFTVSVMVACEAFELTVNQKIVVLALGFVVLLIRRLTTSSTDFHTSIENKAVLITGCDTGIGNLLAECLDSKGVPVFAGCLNSRGEGANKLRGKCSKQLKILQMDVTSEKEVFASVEYVRKTVKDKGLWGIVNNAGLNFTGDIELTTMEQFNQVQQINYLGVVRVTKAFLPIIKESKGRILNFSSMKGRVYSAYTGAYSCTKFAVESFSDILRLEMTRWGVKVAIIEPGNYGGATGCVEMNRIKREFETMWENMSPELRAQYGRKYLDDHLAALESSIPTASFDLLPIIEGVCHALFSLKPQTRYLIPGSSGRVEIWKWLALSSPYLPTWLYDRLLIWAHSSNDLVPAHLE